MNAKRKGGMSEYGYYSDFPERLRAIMENRNEISPLKRKVSQSELANHLGVTRQAVSSYTLGTSIPDMLKFKAIADFFCVSYGYLLGTTNTINEEHNSFVEKSHLPPSTLNAILKLCMVPEYALSFILLVETLDFAELITAITAHLTIRPSGEVDRKTLMNIDEKVRKITDGALCAVPAKLEKDILIMNAQRYLRNAIERIGRDVDKEYKRYMETKKDDKGEEK